MPEIILKYVQVFHDNVRVLNTTASIIQYLRLQFFFIDNWDHASNSVDKASLLNREHFIKAEVKRLLCCGTGQTNTKETHLRASWTIPNKACSPDPFEVRTHSQPLRNHMNKLVSPSPLPFPPTHMRIPQRRSLIYLSLDERHRLFLNNQSFKRTACIVVHF